MYYLKTSFDPDFSDLIMHLKAKYPKRLANIDGIGDEQTDFSQFSKDFFSTRTAASDISIDSNANIDDMSVVTYNSEISKALLRLNSYFVIWKKMKQLYGLSKANQIIEDQFSGAIYINDMHGIGAGMPYSYFGDTSIVIKIDNEIIYTTMKSLFNYYEKEKKILSDMEEIDLSNKSIKILENNNKWVNLTRILRHITDKKLLKIETKNGKCTIVTEDHPVILDDCEKLAKDIKIGDKLKESNTKLELTNKINIPLNEAYQKYSENKKLPENILNWNKTSILSLLAGIIDNNDYISNNTETKIEQITIKLTSFELTQQISELAKSLGFKNIKTSFDKSNNDIYQVSFKITEETKQIINFSKKLSKYEYNFDNSNNNETLETNEIHKIEEFVNFKDQYVYDVTTETGVFHSQGLIQHNCFNFSTYDIALQGLPMIKKIKSVAPKYLYSFKSQLEQFVVIASNSIMGACGLADFVIVASLYIDKIFRTGNDAGFFFDGWFNDEEKEKIIDLLENSPEYKIDDELKTIEHVDKINKSLNKTEPSNKKIFEMNVWKYVKENIVSFIYTINQPGRGGAQSPFTNISLYDKYFLKEMAQSYILFDHTVNMDTVNKLQLLYVDIMNEELKRTPVTFPVTTGCFVIDDNNEIQDKEFLHELAKRNLKRGFINFYCGKSSTLSSCCFRGDETINVYNTKSQENKKITIKEFVEQYSNDKNINKKIEKIYKINSYNINSDDGIKEECYITGILKKENTSKKLIKIQIGDKIIHVTPDHVFKCFDTELKRISKINAMELYNHWEKYLIPIEE